LLRGQRAVPPGSPGACAARSFGRGRQPGAPIGTDDRRVARRRLGGSVRRSVRGRRERLPPHPASRA
jgi:hypothetical protein